MRAFDPENVKFSPKKHPEVSMPKLNLKLERVDSSDSDNAQPVKTRPKPISKQQKREKIAIAKNRELNRKMTLANELNFGEDEEEFFYDEEFYKDHSEILEREDEDFSPGPTPR